MKTIFKYDLRSSVISFKTLLIIILFNIVAFLVSKYSQGLTSFTGGKDSAVSIVYGFIETFGVLFGFLVFSGTISKLVENESIRYIIPHVSRTNILISKIGTVMAYFLLLILSVIPVIMLNLNNYSIPWIEIIQALIFFLYISSIIIFVSVISKNEKNSTFIGIFLGILIPILGSYSIISKNIIISYLSWLLPYRYLSVGFESIFMVLLSALFFVTSLRIFKRKDV